MNIKINSKCNVDLNVKFQILKHFFFFKGENLWVLGLSEGFLHIESKNIIHKREKTGFYENSMFSQKTLLRMRSSYLTKVLECIKDYQNSIKIGTIQLENTEKI